MFERYTERARRVIFFARYEASMFGSTTIETEHLLLGLAREDKNVIDRFASGSAEELRREIESRVSVREKISSSIDLQLSEESKRVLAYANEETERLNHRAIGTEHLLLGMLREDTTAGQILKKLGLELDVVRDQMARTGVQEQDWRGGSPSHFPPADRESVQALLDKTPESSLGWVKMALERLLARPDAVPGFPFGPGSPRFFSGAAVHRHAEGKVKEGRFTTSRNEDGTFIVETQQFFQGHQISTTERLLLTDDGKKLSYSHEIVGPKVEQQQKHSIEFDVS